MGLAASTGLSPRLSTATLPFIIAASPAGFIRRSGRLGGGTLWLPRTSSDERTCPPATDISRCLVPASASGCDGGSL